MATEIICAIITAIATVVVAVLTREIKRSNKENKAYQERRQQESLLSLQMISATMELSIVSANALTGGHNNGNVEAAKAKAKQAEDNYRQFEHKILSEELNKL